MSIETKLLVKKNRKTKLASKYLKETIKKPYDKIRRPITILVEPE
jgi:hypothetical protein